MKRIVSVLGLSVMAILASPASSPAQQGRVFDRPHQQGPGFALGRLRHCLSLLDLTADQNAAIEGILSAARPTIQGDFESLKTARQKVHSDLAAGADPCAVGADVVAQHADANKLHADVAAVRDQVLARLNPDQQSRVEGCFQERQHPH